MGSISMSGQRVVVTGGAGVIGRELLRRLANQGASVLSVDRNRLPQGDWAGVTHLQKDLTVDDLGALREFKPQIVLHLAAAFERSSESPDFWEKNWHDNIRLSHHLIDLCKDLPGLEVFIFASSYLVYLPSLYLSPSRRNEPVLLKEDDYIEPRNLCGAAKYYTERELDFVREHWAPSLRVANARIYRVYGCGSNDVISRWVRAGLAGETIRVYHRQNRFDFIFAGDVAEGLLRLAQSPRAEGAVNLGSGVSQPVQDVLDIIIERIPQVKSLIRNLDASEPFEASGADLSRLKQLTGWTPGTSLEEGIKTVIEFEESRAGR